MGSRRRRRELPEPGRVSKALDRAIEAVAPGLARRRYADRARLAAYHDGAERTRGNRNRSTPKGSADQTTRKDLVELRDASRDLFRNDATARGLIQTRADNIVGHTGMRAMPSASAEATGLSPEAVAEWNKACRGVFERWCRDEADATGHGSFAALQGLALKAKDVDGEALLHVVSKDDPDRVSAWCLELIEPERLENPNQAEDSREWRQGVRIDEFGQAIGYHVLDDHPDDPLTGNLTRAGSEIEARRDGRPNLIHWFDRDHVGQHRGKPLMSAVLTMFNNLKEYLEAEQTAARVAACIALLVKREQLMPDGPIAPDAEFDDDARTYLEKVDPGGIYQLADGESIETFNPTRNAGTFEPFLNRILRAIAAACAIPFELLVKDFSRSNYSSMRSTLLEFWRHVMCQQAAMRDQICDPMYRLVIRDAFARGLLPVHAEFLANQEAFLACTWIRPPRGWVDPMKEIQSTVTEIESSLTSHTEAAAALGRDFTEVAQARAMEIRHLMDLEEIHGLPKGSLTKGGGSPPPSAPPPGQDPEDDEEDPQDGEDGEDAPPDDEDDAEDQEDDDQEEAA